jgi:hypothetical protein
MPSLLMTRPGSTPPDLAEAPAPAAAGAAAGCQQLAAAPLRWRATVPDRSTGSQLHWTTRDRPAVAGSARAQGDPQVLAKPEGSS